jgi:hypothetical protein
MASFNVTPRSTVIVSQQMEIDKRCKMLLTVKQLTCLIYTIYTYRLKYVGMLMRHNWP